MLQAFLQVLKESAPPPSGVGSSLLLLSPKPLASGHEKIFRVVKTRIGAGRLGGVEVCRELRFVGIRTGAKGHEPGRGGEACVISHEPWQMIALFAMNCRFPLFILHKG
jgi:hypothetical protein